MKKQSSFLFVLTLFSFYCTAGLFLNGCASAPKQRLKLGETVDGEVVEAEGLSAVTNDLIGTKRASLADAYKNAIEKVVGIFISARTMVDKAITIQQNILGKTDGYVKKHEVIKEGQEADGLYHTKIRALVSYQQIQNDLKELEVLQAPMIGNPRVAILLDETIQGFEDSGSACTDAIAQGLLERGYKVVDRSELAAIRVAEATQQLLSGNMEQALKPIVQKLNAEVVITGKAIASPITTEGLGGLISYRATLTGKALKAQTGEILAAVSLQGSGLDATKEAASQKAMAQAGKNAANDLASRVANELARRSTVLVIVQGLADLNRLRDIKDFISKTQGVGDIYMRSFSEGRAEMEVKVNSVTSSDLANSISSQASLGAQVVAQTQDSLELKVQ
ncbi:MAG: hypothetical protein HYT97_03740 [Elusimicrobia bacterium]|nr:hypothetical protein [Elusimicrobiota bacterium]